MLLPLLIAVTASHAVSVLTLGRSILTEKIARRGYHLSREYAIDPLEIAFAREVMRSDIVALPLRLSIREVAQIVPTDLGRRVQHLYPVVDDEDRLVGVVTRRDIRRTVQEESQDGAGRMLEDIVRRNPVVAYEDDTLRQVVLRMAETGLTRFPVVERSDPTELVGSISLNNLLAARASHLEAERRRESILKLPRVRAFRFYGKSGPVPVDDAAVDE
jgi:CBS domain-containing protein